MPSKLRVTLCQMAVGRDKLANIAKAERMICEAAKRGSQMVVLPECFNCPYGSKYFEEYSEALAPGNATFDSMSAVAKSNRVWVVAGSIPERNADGKIYNSSMTFSPNGELANIFRKIHLFRLNSETLTVDEGEVMSAGKDANTVQLDDVKFGVAICFDIRYPLLSWKYASEGTSFLVFPAAFNTVTGPLHWELCARARAVDNQQYVLLCSPARITDSDYVAWGHSMIVDPLGAVVATIDEKEGFVDGELDFANNYAARQKIPILNGVRNDIYSLNWKS